MKVIDLLNKIANGEELPKKVKYYDLTYEYNEHLIGINKYRGIEHKGIFLFDVVSNINDEVEVIEENKKIEKLDLDWVEVFDFKEQAQQDCAKMVFNKINEIIDYINKEKDNV